MSETVTQANQAAMPTAVATRQTATTPHQLKGLLSLEDFEEPARRFLPRPIFGYISGGVETNASLAANRAAFGELEFLPRVLAATRARHQKTTIFGRTYDLPFGFPPMGGTSLAAYMGDSVLAKVAAELNTVMIQSGASLTPMERLKAVGPTAWFQAYLPGDPGIITPLVERAQRAGFEVLVLTVDVQVAANRENNVRSGYSSPLKPTPACTARPFASPLPLRSSSRSSSSGDGAPSSAGSRASASPAARLPCWSSCRLPGTAGSTSRGPRPGRI
jgi:L-lactate dehydrogenase (cytochrome)